MQAIFATLLCMRKVTRRSNCPIAFGLDIFGDKWSLLIIRDLALTGKKTYQEFLDSEEHVATNILAQRLRLLEAQRIVRKEPDPRDGRKMAYRLTKKGADLAPILVAMTQWGATYDPRTMASPEFVRAVRKKAASLAR